MKQGAELVDKAIKTTIINMLIYSQRQRKQHEICNEMFHWMRLTADQALVKKGQ